MNQITITEDHIKLIQRMYFEYGYGEFGAPAVNPKRPYGNSDVIGDIAEILEWELVKDRWGDEVVTEDQAARATKLHKETVTVLQILVQYPFDFELGTYVKTSAYGNEYELVE